MKHRELLVIAFCLSVFPKTSLSEIYNCDGKWTNRACEGEVLSTLEESEARAPLDAMRAEKEALLHEIRMKAIRARRDFGFRTELSGVEKLCLNPETSLVVCEEVLAAKEDRLDKRILQERTLLARERELELQEDANRLQEKASGSEHSNTQVTIVEERNYIINRPRHPRGHGSDLYDERYQQQVGGSGLSVSGAAVSSSGTRFELEIGASSSSGRPPRRLHQSAERGGTKESKAAEGSGIISRPKSPIAPSR